MSKKTRPKEPKENADRDIRLTVEMMSTMENTAKAALLYERIKLMIKELEIEGCSRVTAEEIFEIEREVSHTKECQLRRAGGLPTHN